MRRYSRDGNVIYSNTTLPTVVSIGAVFNENINHDDSNPLWFSRHSTSIVVVIYRPFHAFSISRKSAILAPSSRPKHNTGSHSVRTLPRQLSNPTIVSHKSTPGRKLATWNMYSSLRSVWLESFQISTGQRCFIDVAASKFHYLFVQLYHPVPYIFPAPACSGGSLYPEVCCLGRSFARQNVDIP